MPKNFSDYTNLVLDRMASNPEEFMHHSPRSRWGTLIENLQDVARNPTENFARSLWALPKEEIDALVEAYRHIYLKDMHKHMLHQILSGSDVTAEKQMLGTAIGAKNLIYKAKDRYSTGWADPALFTQAQVGNGGIVSATTTNPWANEEYEKGQTVNDSPNHNRF
jgi:hypothetical protein